MKKLILILLVAAASAMSVPELSAQQLSFDMIGTCSIKQAGDCKMSSEPFEVKINVKIDQKTGIISGDELWRNEKGNYEKKDNIAWSGEVLSKSDVKVMRFKQVRQFSCGNQMRSETLHFIGVVDFADSYSLKLEDRYAMCPATNCIFDIVYKLNLKAK